MRRNYPTREQFVCLRENGCTDRSVHCDRCSVQRWCDEIMNEISDDLYVAIKAMHDEIDRLTKDRDYWKNRSIELDGKYQNWIE